MLGPAANADVHDIFETMQFTLLTGRIVMGFLYGLSCRCFGKHMGGVSHVYLCLVPRLGLLRQWVRLRMA